MGLYEFSFYSCMENPLSQVPEYLLLKIQNKNCHNSLPNHKNNVPTQLHGYLEDSVEVNILEEQQYLIVINNNVVSTMNSIEYPKSQLSSSIDTSQAKNRNFYKRKFVENTTGEIQISFSDTGNLALSYSISYKFPKAETSVFT